MFSIPVLPCQGLFSVSLRDPRIPGDPGRILLVGCFFNAFLVLLSKLLFGGFCGQHGLNMGPTWGPKGLQNEEKSLKKGIICCMLFLIEFLLILGGSWVDFWWIFSAKLRAKLTKKSIIWPLVGKLAEVAKKVKNRRKIKVSWCPGLPTSKQNSIKSVPRPIKIQAKNW